MSGTGWNWKSKTLCRSRLEILWCTREVFVVVVVVVITYILKKKSDISATTVVPSPIRTPPIIWCGRFRGHRLAYQKGYAKKKKDPKGRHKAVEQKHRWMSSDGKDLARSPRHPMWGKNNIYINIIIIFFIISFAFRQLQIGPIKFNSTSTTRLLDDYHILPIMYWLYMC